MSVCQLSALPLDGVVMDPTEIRYIFWASEPPELLLRHCQARSEVRAVAPDDQTVFCLINNSYNSRERTGGWRWWRVLECWRVGVLRSPISPVPARLPGPSLGLCGRGV